MNEHGKTQAEAGVLRRTPPVIIVVTVIITLGKNCGVYENQRHRKKNSKEWRRERLRVPGHGWGTGPCPGVPLLSPGPALAY